MSKREGYLRLMGAGDLVSSTGGLKLEKSLQPTGESHTALFGSDYNVQQAETSLSQVFNHFVFWRQTNMVDRNITPEMIEMQEKVQGEYMNSGIRVVGKIKSRFGKKRSLVLDGPGWNWGDPEARILHVQNLPEMWGDGVDPHMVFFIMALRMREKFIENALDSLERVPLEYRPKATLLTEIGTPISAYARTDRGYDIGCEFHQRVTLDTFNPEKDLQPGQLYSRTGEYPIEIPSNIDMERLMRIDLKALENPHLLVGDAPLIEV